MAHVARGRGMVLVFFYMVPGSRYWGLQAGTGYGFKAPRYGSSFLEQKTPWFLSQKDTSICDRISRKKAPAFTTK